MCLARVPPDPCREGTAYRHVCVILRLAAPGAAWVFTAFVRRVSAVVQCDRRFAQLPSKRQAMRRFLASARPDQQRTSAYSFEFTLPEGNATTFVVRFSCHDRLFLQPHDAISVSAVVHDRGCEKPLGRSQSIDFLAEIKTSPRLQTAPNLP